MQSLYLFLNILIFLTKPFLWQWSWMRSFRHFPPPNEEFRFSLVATRLDTKTSAHLSCLVVVEFSRNCMYKCNFISFSFWFSSTFDIFTMKLESYLCEYFSPPQNVFVPSFTTTTTPQLLFAWVTAMKSLVSFEKLLRFQTKA